MTDNANLVELTTHRLGGYTVEHSYNFDVVLHCPPLARANLRDQILARTSGIALELTRDERNQHDNAWLITFSPRNPQLEIDHCRDTIMCALAEIVNDVTKALDVQKALAWLEAAS